VVWLRHRNPARLSVATDGHIGRGALLNQTIEAFGRLVEHIQTWKNVVISTIILPSALIADAIASWQFWPDGKANAYWRIAVAALLMVFVAIGFFRTARWWMTFACFALASVWWLSECAHVFVQLIPGPWFMRSAPALIGWYLPLSYALFVRFDRAAEQRPPIDPPGPEKEESGEFVLPPAPEPPSIDIRVLEGHHDDSVKILHLSDLHLKSKYRLDPLHPKFLKFLKSAIKSVAGTIDLVVVTGDLIDGELLTTAVKESFTTAKEYLLSVCKDVLELDLDEQTLVIIPGNHDVRHDGLFPSPDAVAMYKKRFGKFGKHVLYDFQKSKIKILCACFDSNIGESDLELAMGSVDTSKIDELGEAIAEFDRRNDTRLNDAFRLALLHHQLLPVADAEEFLSETDRKWRRKIIGAPETMILRNAGIVLGKLQKLDFRLVLHGHLHVRSCLQTVSYAHGTSAPRTLEIVGAGSAGRPDQRQRFSFNVLKIRKDHVVEVAPIEFTDGGQQEDIAPMQTANYDTIRAERYDQRSFVDRQPIRCDSVDCVWDIDLPTGDVTMTHVLRGIRNDFRRFWSEKNEDREAPEFVLAVMEPTLTKVEFALEKLDKSATYTTPSYRREVTDGHSNDGVRAVTYVVKFHEPLPRGTKADLLVKWRIFGFQYRSSEDKRYWSMASADTSWDEAAHKIRFPCERFSFTVRFHCNPVTYLPREIYAHVDDSDGETAISEQQSGHLSWSYSYPGKDFALSRDPLDLSWVPYSQMSVYRPQVGFQYSLRWALNKLDPDSTATPEKGTDTWRADLRNLRRRLLGSSSNAAISQELRALLTEIRSRACTICGIPETDLSVYFFGFDESDGHLECVEAVTARVPDLLSGVRINWGRDVIGTAFRRNSVGCFSRSQFDDQGDECERMDNFPTQIQALAALPVIRSQQSTLGARGNLSGWPIGVVALASYNKPSLLEAKLSDQPIMLELENMVRDLFSRYLG
jgi:UDP-2,3-diacylglucosamine pyrophosphatase LpxH